MNQLIEKFARKCGAWNQVYGHRTFMIDEHFDIEKFTKLIVRECSDIACEYDAPKMSGPGIIIAGRIESHFGVEL